MIRSIKHIHHILLGSLAFSFLFVSLSWAQRGVSYRDLVMKQRSQNTYFDFFMLPGNGNNEIQFVSTFRVAYSFLPFKKMNNYGDKERFFSPVSMSIEAFEAESRIEDESENISVEGLNTVARSFWRDTAYAENYQQTNSNNTFIGGSLQVELTPGLYNYLLQLNRSDANGEEQSRVRQVEIHPYSEQPSGSVIYIQNVDNESTPMFLRLLNFGDNVNYGHDFYAFVHLPKYDPGSEYSFRISRLSSTNGESAKTDIVAEQKLSPSNLLTGVRPEFVNDERIPGLKLHKSGQGYSYALFSVPNSEFSNDAYQLEVLKKGLNKPVARSTFRSLWLQMPASLLNLNIAVDMLRFIESDEVISELKEGSQAEREQKFRKYWKSKDPTPKTEYNELMAEYYRRIDYAYEHFSTVNTVGYESDQGQVYIQYGSPQNVERKFPPGEPAVEIWTYNNSKQFLFRATSGFGDFRLVE